MKKLIRFTALTIALLGAANVAAQPLQANGGNSQTICAGQTANLGGSPSASFGSPPYTYSWNPAGAVSDPAAPNPTTTPAGTTTFTLTVTDNVATVATATLTIGVNPAPTVDPVASITTCNTVTTSVPPFSGSVAGAIYSWTNSDPSIGIAASGTGDIPSFNAVNSGSTQVTATISVTATNSGTGCVGPPEVFNIIVNPSQSATFSYPNSGYCLLDANPLPILGSGATAGVFSSTTGLAFVNTLTGEIDLTGSVSGSYNITNTVAASSGCPASSANFTLSIYPLPTIVAVGSDLHVCLGSAATFTSSGSGGTAYLWKFDDGGTATTANTTHIYSAQGLYHASIQAVNAFGCASAIDTQMVYVHPVPVITSVTPVDVTCNSFCNGSATAVVAAGSGPYTFFWAGFGSNINPATGLCPSSSSVMVTDVNGCTSMSASVTITEPPALINTTSGMVTTCFGDSATLWGHGSGGIPPYIYTWDNGGGPVPMADTITIASLTGLSYTVTVRDANNCAGSANAGVVITPSTNISGHITTSGGALNTGVNKAVLLKYIPSYISFDTVQIVSVDASGDFFFPAANTDDYLIKIFPDEAAYPLVVPTYYGNEFLWDSATVLTHGCGSSSTANITMVEAVAPSGAGIISGFIQEGPGFERFPGDPVPGIDIKLGRNPGGQMVSQTVTNSTGEYTFNGVAANVGSEYYTVYVDIPGLERDSVYNVTVTSSNGTFNNLNYWVDSNSVYPIYPTSVSVKDPGLAADVQFSVYPNPANESTTIAYTLKATANVQLDVYDVLGKKVESLVNTNQQSGNYKVNPAKLKAGVYFITLNINNNSSTTRLVVID